MTGLERRPAENERKRNEVPTYLKNDEDQVKKESSYSLELVETRDTAYRGEKKAKRRVAAAALNVGSFWWGVDETGGSCEVEF